MVGKAIRCTAAYLDLAASGELARRAEQLLDERARHYCRVGWNSFEHWLAFESSGCQERDEQLYALAAEFAKHMAKGP